LAFGGIFDAFRTHADNPTPSKGWGFLLIEKKLQTMRINFKSAWPAPQSYELGGTLQSRLL